MLEAIAASLPELQRWMDWALREPESLEAKARRLAHFRRRTLRGRDALLGIFERSTGKVIGGIGMHSGIGSGARAIGYWLRSDRTGHGLATEAAAAIVQASFERLGLRRIEIHCDPANARSEAVAQRLGFARTIVIPKCVPNPQRSPRDTAIWVMTRDQYDERASENAIAEARSANPGQGRG